MNVKAVLFDLSDTLLLLESEKVYYPPSLRRLYEFLVKNGVDVPFEDFRRVSSRDDLSKMRMSSQIESSHALRNC